MSTLVPSFLIGSSSFLQVTRTVVLTGSQVSLDEQNFDQIRQLTTELAALERLKNQYI